MEKKNITIDDLAGTVRNGFEETAKKDEVNMRFDKVNMRFDKVDTRFDKIEDRLERIEKLILADHKRRIEKLETEVKELKELLAIK